MPGPSKPAPGLVLAEEYAAGPGATGCCRGCAAPGGAAQLARLRGVTPTPASIWVDDAVGRVEELGCHVGQPPRSSIVNRPGGVGNV